jgi:alkyl hydroperoxide reductase subunit AhpF
MPLLNEEVRKKVSQRLEMMTRPVTMVVYAGDDEESEVLRTMTSELAELTDKLSVEEGTGSPDGSDLQPALAFRVDGQAGPGVRFYGAPTGYEFSSLLEGLVDLGTGKTALSAATREKLAALTQPVTLKVFTTPT